MKMAFNKKNKRLVGIDVARALAVIGMIIVNFKMAFGQEGNGMIVFIYPLIKDDMKLNDLLNAGLL